MRLDAHYAHRHKGDSANVNLSASTDVINFFSLPLYPNLKRREFTSRWKARVKSGCAGALAKAIADRSLGRGSIAGDEYWYDMQMARVNAKGEAHWVETCFCDATLEEERLYWEKYFNLLSVKDAHSRRNCRHENGTDPWACCNCDCTKRLEERLAQTGKSFLQELHSF